jgi:hypothetical protein
MNRLYILLTVMVGALFTGQEALAKVLTGTAGDDTLVGTNGDDHIEGRAGDDTIKGRGGDDTITPGEGDDHVDAGPGDHIFARDTRGVDFINCGDGFDEVETIHRDDKTKRNCESPRPSRRYDNGYNRHHHRHEHNGYHDRYEHNGNDGHHYWHHGCVNREDHWRYHWGEHYRISDQRRYHLAR